MSNTLGMKVNRRSFLTHAASVGVAAAVEPLTSLRGEVLHSSDDGSVRSRTTFDFGWKFSTGDFPEAHLPGFVDKEWHEVELPHDWSIAGPFSQDAACGGAGGYVPTGFGWYRKHFEVTASLKGKKVSLEFDAIYERSEVWINGHYLGFRPYGYISFFYDVTPFLNYGKPNIVAVKVDNSLQPSSRSYSGSGIYRHTWMRVTDEVHVAQWGTYITTPQVMKASATVEVRTRVLNESAKTSTCVLSTSIIDANGQTVGSISSTQSILAKDEYTFSQQITVNIPALWSVDQPSLYTLSGKVQADGRTTDSTVENFGIRKIAFDVNKGFLLNDQHVKMNGVCLRADGGSVGAAIPEGMWERRLKTLKGMGCNAIRTAHNPPAPEFLDMCDRMGFLVMDEAFDEWREHKEQTTKYNYAMYFDEWHERDTTAMIHRDRNHPSIVLWSAGNEIPDQMVAEGPQTLRGMLDIFHTEDPTRPVTAACDRIVAEPDAALPEFLALLDIVGYNYVDRWRDRAQKYYSIDRHAYPQRRFIGTESNGMGGALARGRMTRVEGLQKWVQTYDYVSGDFMWAGIDYLGEARWPAKSASAGILDTCGFIKDGYYFYQSLWTTEPVLHIFPHWNQSVPKGQIVTVTCFTNCDTVELFLNDVSYGVKGYLFPAEGMEGKYPNMPERAKEAVTTEDLHLSWDIPYTPGTVKAIGKKLGQVIKSAEISTTGQAAAIRLSVDAKTIKANRLDVVHVAAEVIDSEGRIVPIAENDINFELQGEAKIIGVDNGNPISHESFKANNRKAFNGRCLVILQSTDKPGKVTLRASSGTLQGSTVELTTTS
jgi:beta-galactosidase